MEGDLDETLGIAVDEDAIVKRRKGRVEALAILLVAGGAVGVAKIDFVAGRKALFLGIGKVCRDGWHGILHFRFLALALQAGCCGFDDLFAPHIRALGLGDRRHLNCFRLVIPGRGDNSLKPHAAVFVVSSLFQQIERIGKAVEVVTDYPHGSGTHVEVG